MKPIRSFCEILLLPGVLLLLAALLAAAPAVAKEWTVRGYLAGKDGATTDLSGIACAQQTGFPRTCLVIDDELQKAQIVTLRDGVIVAGAQIKLIDDRYKDKPVELDGEGVAFADGYFYVVGSHGLPRKDMKKKKRKARIAADSKLVRLKYDTASDTITLDPAAPSLALRKLIDDDPAFKPFEKFKDRLLEKNGITVEGIAVVGKKLYIGFRGPTLDENDDDEKGDRSAIILSAALDHFFGDVPSNADLHRLKLGDSRGVRDLAPFAGGLLILSGPVTSDSGRYSIHWWNGEDGENQEIIRIADIPNYFGLVEDKKTQKPRPEQWKPEAMLPFDRKDDGAFVLVLMDKARGGNPREFRIIYPEPAASR